MCSLTYALGSNIFCSLAHGVIPSDNQPDTAIGIIYSMPVNEIGTLDERAAERFGALTAPVRETPLMCRCFSSAINSGPICLLVERN